MRIILTKILVYFRANPYAVYVTDTKVSRARPHALQARGEGLVKSLHASRAPGMWQTQWILAC